MGILPDWLGEGGFIAVAANPPAGARTIGYARRPVRISALSYAGLTRYPPKVSGAGYSMSPRTAGVNAVSYLISSHNTTGVSGCRYVSTRFPVSVSNLSFH